MNKQQSISDIRFLTFKRWNLPHTSSICDFPNRDGRYVSFQHYHFIDIQQVQQPMNSNCFHELYNMLQNEREAFCNNDDVHNIQSMMLVGECTDFWDYDPSIIYMSFIQLTDWNIKNWAELKNDIVTNIDAWGQSGNNVHHALYKSLDFCDLVLFTAGLSMRELQNGLENLTLGRERDSFVNIRDAFSFCCFQHKFLQTTFQVSPRLLNKSNEQLWNDIVSFSVDLSIQTCERWNKLLNDLNSICEYEQFKTLGRYDVRLCFTDIPGNVALQIFAFLDKSFNIDSENKFFLKDNQNVLSQAIGGYNISFLTSGSSIPKTGKQANIDTSLYNITKKVMDKSLAILNNSVINNYIENVYYEYIKETFSALTTLSKSGFADEFIISVLPSLQFYIKLVDKYSKFNNKGQHYNNVYSDADPMSKSSRMYFRALNALALCTMHDERQFIQSPAFQANYFDIPSKLLAFFNTIANNIVQILAKKNSDEAKKYCFIVVPDYRNDIEVKPLPIRKKDSDGDLLNIVYLPEFLFYDPINAIAIICHEIAHYVGNRKREVRARYIFQSIGVCLFQRNFLSITNVQAENYDDSLLKLLSLDFSEYAIDKITEYSLYGQNENQYFLNTLSDFLNDNNYGLDLLQNSSLLMDKWKISLNNSFKENKLKDEFDNVIQKINDTLYVNNYNTDENISYCIDVFIRFLIWDSLQIETKLYEYNSNDTENDFNKVCENIVQAFSEAYADLHMLKIGCSLISEDMYVKFLNIDTEHEDTQLILRYRSICHAGIFAAPKYLKKFTFNDDISGHSYEIVSKLLAEYLKVCMICYGDTDEEQELRNIFEVFSGNDAIEQIRKIREVIAKYREQILDMLNSFEV